jgi:DNA-binding response OmpR family regulator
LTSPIDRFRLDTASYDRWQPGIEMPLRLLLVEDFPDCAAMTAVVLREYGHDVRVARDGPSALAAFRSERPDAVLLDIGLPGMSGYEFAKQLRDEFAAATPKIIAITGYGRRADRMQSAAAGIDVHLVKPFDWTELNSILDGLKPSDPVKP